MKRSDGPQPNGIPTKVEKASMLIPVVVACAFFMDNFDATVITTVLPEMAESFGESPIAVSSGITAYLVSLAIFIPVSGWAADRFGVRLIFRLAIGVFTVAAIFCGLASSLPEFVAARALQGIGGAMMVPVGRLAVLRAVEKSQFVRAMSYVTTPALIGGALGPPIGGFLSTYFSWRLIFFLQVPIGILGIVLVSIYFEDHEADRRPLDWRGFLLNGVALSCLMVALEAIARGGHLTLPSLALLGIGAGVAGVAVAHATRHEHPLIDVSLLRIPTFAKSVGTGSLFVVTAAAVPFLLPLLLQIGFGMTAFMSGLLTLVLGAGAFAMKAVSPMVLRRFGFRAVLVGNGILVAAATLLCSWLTQATPLLLIALILLLFGVARSLQFVALNTIAYANVPRPRMSSATSFASTMRQVSNAAGVAGAAILLQASVGDSPAGLTAEDVQFALVAVGIMASLSALLFLRLDPEAGSEVSGHVPKQRTQ